MAGKTGVSIEWDKRSLQDFESFPVKELARQYDLIVIDHPHVGQITAESCLTPLDVAGREDEGAALEKGSVGASCPSYHYEGRQWAFPLDAAAQVMAYREDLVSEVPEDWENLMELASEGRVLLPLRPPHNLMTFYTLAANAGTPCRNDVAGPLIAMDDGIAIYERLAELASMVPAENFAMDPIAVLEALAAPQPTAVLSPYIYGYVNYAIDGFRPHRLTFADIPALGEMAPAARRLAAPALQCLHFPPTVTRPSTMPTGLQGPWFRPGSTLMPAASRAMTPDGPTRRSTPRPTISTAIRAGRWRHRSCDRATTATCAFRRRLRKR
nr:hypothetical protein [Marinicella sp. W31]MDC2878441.1 hypothetical protein [Marinicella sp. W31]